MTSDDIKFLKSKIDKEPVQICFTDGEEVTAKVLFVSEEEEDFIYDVLSTNRHDKSVDKANTYSASFADVKKVSDVR